jgi:hypothetical protein
VVYFVAYKAGQAMLKSGDLRSAVNALMLDFQ